MTNPFPLTAAQQLLAHAGLVDYTAYPPELSADYHKALRAFDYANQPANEARMIDTLERLATGIMLKKSGADREGTEQARWSRRFDGELKLYQLTKSPEDEVLKTISRIAEAYDKSHPKARAEKTAPATGISRAGVISRT